MSTLWSTDAEKVVRLGLLYRLFIHWRVDPLRRSIEICLYGHQRSAQVHYLVSLVLTLARLLGLLWFGYFRLWVLGSTALQGDLMAVGADTSTPWSTAFDGGINTLRS